MDGLPLFSNVRYPYLCGFCHLHPCIDMSPYEIFRPGCGICFLSSEP